VVERPGARRQVSALVLVEGSTSAGPALLPMAAAALPSVLAESCCFLFSDDASRRGFYEANLDLLSSMPWRRLLYPHRREGIDPALDLLEDLEGSRGCGSGK
jgi:hypothetical protein